jgi:hypothetical protein
MVPADRFFGAESEVRKAIEATIEKNALRLALGEAPRRPVYLVGQIDGESVSLHGESGRVVVSTPDGGVREIQTKDLGVNARAKEASDERKDEGHDGDDEPGGAAVAGPGRGPGGSGGAAAASADGAEAHAVPGAGEDAGAGAGAVDVGERGGAAAGAHDGGGGAQDVAGEAAP